MQKIDILLATYNGGKYIEEQISSIIAQSYGDWRLFVHDDGSTDNTISVVEKIASKDSRIELIKDGFLAKNAGTHFLYMLHFSDAPFVCFCDQDDIWAENKLETMLGVIEKKDNTKAQVVFSDAFLFKQSIEDTYGKLLFSRPENLKELLFINGGIHGSASMFNAQMREQLKYSFENIKGAKSMHDHFLTLIGCSFGEVEYLDDKLFFYRQHQNNVTGNMTVTPFKRIRNAFSGNGKYVLAISTIESIKLFHSTYKKNISSDDTTIIDNFVSLGSRTIIIRFFMIAFGGYSISQSKLHLLIKVLTRKFIDTTK